MCGVESSVHMSIQVQEMAIRLCQKWEVMQAKLYDVYLTICDYITM